MQFSITFNTSQTSDEIHLIAKLDNNVIETWTASAGIKTLTFDVNDTDDTVARCIAVEMLGKSNHHTVLDNSGNIVSDHYITIENITFDDIDVTDLYCNGNPCYAHSNTTDEFYGFIGINGVVCIDFYTPMWKWFLSKCK